MLPSLLKCEDPNYTINTFWGQPGILATVSMCRWLIKWHCLRLEYDVTFVYRPGMNP